MFKIKFENQSTSIVILKFFDLTAQKEMRVFIMNIQDFRKKFDLPYPWKDSFQRECSYSLYKMNQSNNSKTTYYDISLRYY